MDWSYSGLYPPPELSCNSTAAVLIVLVELTRARGRGVGGCARVRIRLDRVLKWWEGTLVVRDCRGREGSGVGCL